MLRIHLTEQNNCRQLIWQKVQHRQGRNKLVFTQKLSLIAGIQKHRFCLQEFLLQGSEHAEASFDLNLKVADDLDHKLAMEECRI